MATAGMRGGVDWMRKLAFRFRKIKENYNTYSKYNLRFFIILSMLFSGPCHRWPPVTKELSQMLGCGRRSVTS